MADLFEISRYGWAFHLVRRSEVGTGATYPSKPHVHASRGARREVPSGQHPRRQPLGTPRRAPCRAAGISRLVCSGGQPAAIRAPAASRAVCVADSGTRGAGIGRATWMVRGGVTRIAGGTGTTTTVGLSTGAVAPLV